MRCSMTREEKLKWVRAYPLVAGIPLADTDFATPAELDEAFARILANTYLQRMGMLA